MDDYDYFDNKNIYKMPKTKSNEISYYTTYLEGISMFGAADNYLHESVRDMKAKILVDEQQIYAVGASICQEYGEAAEMLLKAVYIKEHENENVDEVWEFLKNKQEERDSYGDLLYIREDNVVTHIKRDENGNSLLDKKGNPIYEDDIGNIYKFNEKGRKFIRNGHQLDRLIDLLSDESQSIIRAMITSNYGRDNTYSYVTPNDILKSKELVTYKKNLSDIKYESLLNEHKKIFEEGRYCGQNFVNYNVKFMHELTNNIIKAAQHILFGNMLYKFPNFTDDMHRKIPPYIKTILKVNPGMLTEDDCVKIINDPLFDEKCRNIISGLPYTTLVNFTSHTFSMLLNNFDNEELSYLLDVINIVETQIYTRQRVGLLKRMENIQSLAACYYLRACNVKTIVTDFYMYKINNHQKITYDSLKELIKFRRRVNLDHKIPSNVKKQYYKVISIKDRHKTHNKKTS
jgi:hypothetical protein